MDIKIKSVVTDITPPSPSPEHPRERPKRFIDIDGPGINSLIRGRTIGYTSLPYETFEFLVKAGYVPEPLCEIIEKGLYEKKISISYLTKTGEQTQITGELVGIEFGNKGPVYGRVPGSNPPAVEILRQNDNSNFRLELNNASEITGDGHRLSLGKPYISLGDNCQNIKIEEAKENYLPSNNDLRNLIARSYLHTPQAFGLLASKEGVGEIHSHDLERKLHHVLEYRSRTLKDRTALYQIAAELAELVEMLNRESGLNLKNVQARRPGYDIRELKYQILSLPFEYLFESSPEGFPHGKIHTVDPFLALKKVINKANDREIPGFDDLWSPSPPNPSFIVPRLSRFLRAEMGNICPEAKKPKDLRTSITETLLDELVTKPLAERGPYVRTLLFLHDVEPRGTRRGNHFNREQALASQPLHGLDKGTFLLSLFRYADEFSNLNVDSPDTVRDVVDRILNNDNHSGPEVRILKIVEQKFYQELVKHALPMVSGLANGTTLSSAKGLIDLERVSLKDIKPVALLTESDVPEYDRVVIPLGTLLKILGDGFFYSGLSEADSEIDSFCEGVYFENLGEIIEAALGNSGNTQREDIETRLLEDKRLLDLAIPRFIELRNSRELLERAISLSSAECSYKELVSRRKVAK